VTIKPEGGIAVLADRVHTRNVPMQALPVDAGVLDVAWSEGTAYLMGFGEALTSSRPPGT
jgi:hypothetical protein